MTTQPVVPQQPVVQQPASPRPVEQAKLSPEKRSIDWPLVLSVITFVVAGALFVCIERERSLVIQEKEKKVQHEQEKNVAATVSAESVRLIDTAFISETDVIVFIQSLEKTRSSFTGFDLSFASDQPKGAKQKFLTFEVLLEGPVENIRSFIDALLSSPYIIDVNMVELLSENGFDGSASLKLEGNLYITEK